MAMMTMLRNRMHVVLWALLILFLLSMTVGGLVGGANIIDQLLGRVNPAEAIGLVNGQKITPNQFNQAVNAQMDAIRNSGTQISDQDLDRVRSQVWNGFIEEYLTKQAIEDLEITVSDEEIIYHLENNPPIDIQRLFYENNVFNEERYQQALKTPGMIDWTPIEAWMKEYYIPRFKLQQYISMSSVVSENDVKEEFIKRNIDYTISALHITNNSIKNKVSKPSNEELLIQTEDLCKFNNRDFKVVSKKKPNSKQMKNLIFAFNVCRYVKSNAIVLASNESTTGIGSGQPSRLDSCQIAIDKMRKFINTKDEIVAASDAFFPFVDGIEKLVQSGVAAVIQPSGSIRDKEIINFANETDTILVFSKTRHFRH